MVINESLGFLVVLIFTVIIGLLLVFKLHLTTVRKFELFLTYLGAFAALMFTYDIFITMKFNEKIEKNRIAYNTIDNIIKNYLEPQKELVDYYPEGFFLYASMLQDINLDSLKPTTFDAAKRKEVEIYLSLRIFQSVEDFLSTAAYDITGIYVWINNYLMWFQSPILQDNWKILGFNYSDDTREIIGRIIEKADHLVKLRKQKGSLTFQDYDTISKAFPLAVRY